MKCGRLVRMEKRPVPESPRIRGVSFDRMPLHLILSISVSVDQQLPALWLLGGCHPFVSCQIDSSMQGSHPPVR